MLDMLGKLFKAVYELASRFEVGFNTIVRNIVLWLVYYFRGYDARIAAILGGALVILLIFFFNFLSGIGDSWRRFVGGEVARQPGRVRSGCYWLWLLVKTVIINGILLYIIGHFIWNILLALRYLPIY